MTRECHVRFCEGPGGKLLRATRLVFLVAGTEFQARRLCDQAGQVLAPMGLRLSETKTVVTYISRGFDFPGSRIRKRRKPGSAVEYVYTWPRRQALARLTSAVRRTTQTDRNGPLRGLLSQLNPKLRGWANYFQYGVSKTTFGYVRAFTW